MEIYIKESGHGPALVLIHGWGLHGGLWDPLVPALGDFHVMVPDLPGHGRSRGAQLTNLAELAEVISGQLPARAIWVGWSLGALIAMTAARLFPERIEKMVLVGATPCFVQTPDWSCALAPDVLDQFAHDLARDYRGTLWRFLSLHVGPGEPERPLLRSLRAAAFQHGMPETTALQAGLALLKETDLRTTLPAIHTPVLVIHGARDRLAPSAAGRFLATRLPRAKWVAVDKAGHAPFLSHPQLFQAELEAFLHAD